MNQLANAFGKDFVKNKEIVRTRAFTLGGHTFKVKVPLTSEFEAMQERMKQIDETKAEQYYKEMTDGFEQFKGQETGGVKCEWLENDLLIDGRSMRETARNKVLMQNRITEMFKLLVPEEKGFDMGTITYDMIEELFPFPIQMQLLDELSNTISPTYEIQRGK